MNDPTGTEPEQKVDRATMSDRQDVGVDGHLHQPLDNTLEVLCPTLSARDDEVGVETLECLKLSGVESAALPGSQALEDPEVSLGETWLFDVVRQTKVLRGLLAARSRAAVDGVEAGCVKVDRSEGSALIIGETLFADTAEDTLSIESGKSVPQT